MASFGENLRREREMRGVTLQEISAATKISVRFLQAVENEEFGKVPGGIFTRSFIRAYAKYLGLDEERVLAEYHLVVPARADLDINRIIANNPQPRQEGSRGPVLAILVAVLLLTGGYLLYRYTRASEDAVISAPRPAPAPQTQPSAAAAPEATTAVGPGTDLAATSSGKTAVPGQEAGAGTAAGTSAVPASPLPMFPATESGVVLQVAATERVWIAVDADGKMALQRVLAPGEIETLRAKDSFDVTTGNALGVVLTLNGETLKPLGRRGEVKSIRLTRRDTKKTPP